MKKEKTNSPILCRHANEVPAYPCLCDGDCYCKKNTCNDSFKIPSKNANTGLVQMELYRSKTLIEEFIEFINTEEEWLVVELKNKLLELMAKRMKD